MIRFHCLFLLLLSTFFLITPVAAETKEQASPAWRPPQSMRDHYDWIKLTSDEWLKGDLIALYDAELEFDSDELGLLTFDWDDVAEVLSHQEQSLRLLDGSIVFGKLHITGEDVDILRGKNIRKFKRFMIVSIASSSDNEWNYWSGKISLAVNIRGGSTDQKDYTTDISTQRRSAQSRLINSYLGNYTSINDITTDNNHRYNSSFDWFLNHRLFWRAMTFEYFRDPFQNIAERYTASTEVGYRIVDNSRFFWEVAGGPGYQQTEFESIAAGEDSKEKTPIGTFSTDVDWEITTKTEYLFHYDVQIVSERAGDYIHHLKMGFDIEIIKDFDLEFSYIWDRIENPAEDDLGIQPDKDNTRFVIGLGYKF